MYNFCGVVFAREPQPRQENSLATSLVQWWVMNGDHSVPCVPKCLLLTVWSRTGQDTTSDTSHWNDGGTRLVFLAEEMFRILLVPVDLTFLVQRQFWESLLKAVNAVTQLHSVLLMFHCGGEHVVLFSKMSHWNCSCGLLRTFKSFL